MEVDNQAAIFAPSYDFHRRERAFLRQWENFIQDVMSGARKLSDKPTCALSNGLQLEQDAANYLSKARQIEGTQREELHAYWREMRKEVAKLNKLSLVNQWFGTPGTHGDSFVQHRHRNCRNLFCC
jgi:hypothetical protein